MLHATGRRSGSILLRKLLISMAAVLMLSCSSSSPNTQSEDGVNFVLIHGAWHGGWAWDPIVSRLESEGHNVWAPTLPGMEVPSNYSEADKSQISLDDHIVAITELLEQHQLTEVVLVGHSYAGMVAAGVLGHGNDRIDKIVLLDAILPEDGDSLDSFVEISPEQWQQIAAAGLSVPVPPEAEWPQRWGIPEELIPSVRNRIVSQPARTFLDSVSWSGPESIGPKHYYIRCIENPNPAFNKAAERVQGIESWTYAELASHHDAMLTVPDELTHLLLQFAGSVQ